MGRHREKPIAEPVQELMRLAGVSTSAELAAALGASRNNVENWVKGRAVPEKWLAVARGLEMPPQEPKKPAKMNEIESVTTEPFSSEDGGPLHFAFGRPGASQVEYEVVPRYAVRVSAGKGVAPFDEDERGSFAFEKAWMRRHLGRTGDGFASVEVRGDSMEPALLDGEEIIIDRRVNRVDASGIYVIALRGDLLVKRVQRKLDGTLIVRGDNPAYEPETLTAERAEELRIVGRMVWPRVR